MKSTTLFGQKDAKNRRDVIIETAGLALTSMLVGSPPWLVRAEETASITPQTMIITGSNSGIGFEACKRLVQKGHRLVLACRTLEKARGVAEQLREYGDGSSIPAECDLANLASIKSFSENLPSLLSDSKIDRLCLNAGLARNAGATDCVRTVDGFELTGTYHA